jgi:2-(1,2-epoxy-1,2-dihydrophenyl)acetyl-CoA isomerase
VTGDVVVESADGVLRITLDRPNRKNALTRAMIGAITDAITGVAFRSDVRVVVIAASGPDFCSGIDLEQVNQKQAPGAQPRIGHIQRELPFLAHGMMRALEVTQVPVVASVRGWAAGIGNALALSADVVVADTTAQFWVPMVQRGFTPDSGNTWILPRLIGLARAKQMLLMGRPIDGATAAQWGLIAECVEPDALDASVAQFVGAFASAATVAVGLTRSLIHQNLSVDLQAALHNEGIHEELALRTDDFKEGIRSFMEKRLPDYRGR